MQFQRIRVNVVRKPRFAVMEGRDYIVLPVVILTEGVHSGSNGPVLYLLEDMDKFVPAWNHKPIVVYHPKKDGQFVSADDPAILSANKVGILMANKINGKGQEAEAWLEKDRLKAVDSRVLDAINDGIIVEVSTGLFTDNEDKEGDWNGESYSAIARNYRPDHLALLPDLVGACSVQDGCGLFTAAEAITLNKAEELQKAMEKVLEVNNVEHPIEDFAYAPNPDDPSGWRLPISNESLLDQTVTFLESEPKEEDKIPSEAMPTVKARVRNAWKKYKKKKKVPDSVNELSHGELGNALYELICAPQYVSPPYHYIQEVYEDYVVYAVGDDFYKQDFSVTDDDVELVGEPTQVKKDVSYNPVGANDMSKNAKCECGKEVKALVDNLIFSNKNWKEDDREYLESQEEPMLKKFQAMETVVKAEPKVEPKEEPEVEVNTDSISPKKKQVTTEEYIKNAPPQIRKILASGLRAHEAEEKRLADIIMSNETNQFTEDELKKMDYPMLQKLAALAITNEEEKSDQPIDLFNYVGNVGAPQSNSSHQEEALPLPVMKFEKK